MKVLVFVCFIAVCASLPITGKQIVVQDGLVTVTSSKYQYSIMRSSDPKKIEVVFKTTGVESHLVISEPTKIETTGNTHFDVVKRIFSQYGSVVDDVTYHKILKRIEILVNDGVLNKFMWVVLQHLESAEEMEMVHGVNDVDKPKIMIGVPTRKIETRDITAPMQHPTQYQRDLMNEIPEDMFHQQYVTPMYLQKYQGIEQGLKYQPMMDRMYEQNYMTPMNRFWETLKVPQIQNQQMVKNVMFQRTVPQDLMYQYPVQKDSRQVPEYIMRTMMEDPMMEEKMAEHKMMNRNMMNRHMMNTNMMYEPMMKHMMTGNMMTPRMSVENIMEPYMQNHQMMGEHMMTPYMSTKMGEQMKTQRLMEQPIMDEYMMEDMKY